MEGELIGLTGGIACGKSEVAGILMQFDVPVLDTDVVAHSLLEPGHWVYEKVLHTFGKEYMHPEGGIHRRKLGALVFTDPDSRAELNAIMHPEVFAEVDRWVESELAGREKAVVMIPLLFETKCENRFKRIIAVASDEKHMEERLIARGFTRSEARARIEAQMPVSEKVSRADIVIWNNGDLQDLRQETLTIWNTQILGKETAK